MGDETHTEETFNAGSASETPGLASHGVFSDSHHFTVAGGTFNNTTTSNYYHKTPTVPSDFRRIPMGDIDLQHEICLDKYSRVADYRRERRGVRRVYSAKIDGGTSSVTVATYQGESAEEEWRGDIAKYMAVRHPNIVQLCGTASSGNIHATIFHDDLIPYRQFLELHRHSHLSNVYIYAYLNVEFKALRDYFYWNFQYSLYDDDCTFFVRRSTGRICMDLAPGDIYLYMHMNTHLRRQTLGQTEFKSLNTPILEAAAIDSLTFAEYHQICYLRFSQHRYVSVYNPITVHVGAVISWSSGNRLEDFVKIAVLSRIGSNLGMSHWNTAHCTEGDIMKDGWTRFSSSDTESNATISLRLGYLGSDCWLSQANHIFSHLGISSDFEDYTVLNHISFEIGISRTTADPPEGFLFLCPPEDIQIGPSSFKWPDHPAYWSLDPFGADRLSWEDAANLGFPSLQLSENIWGYSWDASVYAGIRQFHQTKGFDPDSQEVAIHLGHPLYELSSGIHIPFAHIDDQCFGGMPEEEDPSGSITDPENIFE